MKWSTVLMWPDIVGMRYFPIIEWCGSTVERFFHHDRPHDNRNGWNLIVLHRDFQDRGRGGKHDPL